VKTEIGRLVISAQNIRCPVVVVIGSHHAHAGVGPVPDAARLADVLKRAVAAIAKQVVRQRNIVIGSRIDRNSKLGSRHMPFVGKVRVIGDIQIEMAIILDVEKADAGAELVTVGDSRLLGNIGKRAIAVVSKEHLRTKI
jgi:hypothetical protein